MSFTNCFFLFSRPPGYGFGLAFDASERLKMEDLAAFNVREVKTAAAVNKERDEYSSAEGQ